MLTFEKDGLWAGHVNIWGDWAAHISYTTALATQSFFPPQFPILAGHVLSYPFGADLLSALLVKAGISLVPAMLAPSYLLSIALIVILFIFYDKILSNTKAAVLAVFLFLLNGGLGFLWFIADFRKLGWGIFLKLPKEYTLLRGEPNIEWINIITSEIMPQRGFLLGLPIVIFIFMLLWKIYTGPAAPQKRRMIVAGIATGLLPIIHMHSFFVVLGVAAWTALLTFTKTKKLTLWFFYLIPALLLAIPLIEIFYPQLGTNQIKFKFGWLAGPGVDNILFFWFKNAGVMLFLPIFGLWIAYKKKLYQKLIAWSIPFWGLFLVANLFIFQPYEWDNTKFFTYWWLLAAGFAALFLQSLLTKWPLKVLALLLFFLAIFSGSLDVLRLTQHENLKIRMLSPEAIHLASWARENTPKEAIFLTADNHDNALAMLSGRRIVLGFRGWLWTYGIDTSQRSTQAEKIYRGEDAEELLAKLDVDYLLISEAERSRYESLDESFFAENFPLVYSERTTKVFKNDYGIDN